MYIDDFIVYGNACVEALEIWENNICICQETNLSLNEALLVALSWRVGKA